MELKENGYYIIQKHKSCDDDSIMKVKIIEKTKTSIALRDEDLGYVWRESHKAFDRKYTVIECLYENSFNTITSTY